MGRPTKYKEEYCEDIYKFMAEGKSKEAWAGSKGFSKHRIYDWAEKHKKFRHAVKRGEAACQNFWEEMGIQMALAGAGNATVWIFNMKNRFKWKDRSDVTTDDKQLPSPIYGGKSTE